MANAVCGIHLSGGARIVHEKKPQKVVWTRIEERYSERTDEVSNLTVCLAYVSSHLKLAATPARGSQSRLKPYPRFDNTRIVFISHW